MMSPTRPYFLRAVYQWIIDNDCTPHLAVNAMLPEVSVPEEYVEDGQIVLNISPSAVQSLMIENEFLSFSARFAGAPRNVYVPMQAVLGVYARENGQGMAFPDEPAYLKPAEPAEDDPHPPSPPPKGRPSLKVVK